jgi:hypothetical protein
MEGFMEHGYEMLGSLTTRDSIYQLYDYAYLKEHALSFNYKQVTSLLGWAGLFNFVNCIETYLFIFNQLFIR